MVGIYQVTGRIVFQYISYNNGTILYDKEAQHHNKAGRFRVDSTDFLPLLEPRPVLFYKHYYSLSSTRFRVDMSHDSDEPILFPDDVQEIDFMHVPDIVAAPMQSFLTVESLPSECI